MSSNRHRLRKRLQQACEPVICAPCAGSGSAEAARPAIPWTVQATGMPQEATRSGENELGVSFPWTLPEGLLLWREEWGSRWIVQQGVLLPQPDGSADRKLRRLRVDPPQEAAAPHRLPARTAFPCPKPNPPLASSRQDASAGQPPVASVARDGRGQQGPDTRSVRRHASPAAPPSLSPPEETAAGIPQLYLELAQAWREHPRWQSPGAALLCPVDPAQHHLHELAIHLAGALAHLEKSETLVVDFRPQAAAGPWHRQGGGLWELLESGEASPRWETLLRSTAYQRVWYLPRGRRKRTRHRRPVSPSPWKHLLSAWKGRFAVVLILGPQATALTAEQIPEGKVPCCLLAVVEASSRQEVLAAEKRLHQLTGSPPLGFALPEDSWPVASSARAA